MCRRGAVVAQVAIGLGFMLGLAALVIDLGMIYNTRAELQRTADAAALAAATRLGDWSQGSAMTTARSAAQESANSNKVLGAGPTIDESDVIFGRASLPSAGGKYTFVETNQFPNAVRVRVRRTADSSNGAVPTLFANIFGIQQVDVGAKAAAVLVPRDIVFVMDLSSSHNDDSQLRAYKKTTISNRPVWEYLKDWSLTPRTDGQGFGSKVTVSKNGDGTSTVTIMMTSDASSSTSPLSQITFGLPAGAQAAALASAASSGGYAVTGGTSGSTGVSGLTFSGLTLGTGGSSQTATFSFSVADSQLAGTMMTVSTTTSSNAKDSTVQYNLGDGPLFGNMNTWGTAETGPSWAYASDPGLSRLAKGSAWSLTSSTVSQSIQSRGFGTYTSAEMTAINSSSGDSNTASYRRRVRVALGIDRWKSGKSGGQSGGNGDNIIDASEIQNIVPYPGSTTNPATGCKKVGGSWDAFIDYVISSSSTMCTYDPTNGYYGDSGLRYRFGLKTWLDYILEAQEGTTASPGLDGAPSQPMGAVVDAVKVSLDIIETLQGDDMVGTAAYADTGYGPSDKSDHLSCLTSDTSGIRSQVSLLQAGMWSSNTATAAGIDKGKAVLLNSPASAERKNAAKVMILLTDGLANRRRTGGTDNAPYTASKNDARTAAQEARNSTPPIQIYTISVGACADTDLMEEIAQIGGGEHYHAEGTVAEYKAQLEEIFQKLGGKRPVILIE
jgi:hypothetical protein